MQMYKDSTVLLHQGFEFCASTRTTLWNEWLLVNVIYYFSHPLGVFILVAPHTLHWMMSKTMMAPRTPHWMMSMIIFYLRAMDSGDSFQVASRFYSIQCLDMTITPTTSENIDVFKPLNHLYLQTRSWFCVQMCVLVLIKEGDEWETNFHMLIGMFTSNLLHILQFGSHSTLNKWYIPRNHLQWLRVM